MGTFEIKYGDDILNIEVDVPFTVLDSPSIEAGNEESILKNCLANPTASLPLDEFLEDVDDIVVIVSDATRATPTPRVLDFILPDIIKISQVRFIVGCGTHPAPDEEDLRLIFGHHLDSLRDKITIHDSKDEKNLVSLGATTRGTPILLNKLAVEADRVITIGNVEPHYFAGFSGGRKSILPAVAAYASIEQNHSHTLSEGSYPTALEGNPVHEDMMEALELLGADKIFTVQTVISVGKELVAAFSGNIKDAFFKAVEVATGVYCCSLDEKADIVVTCVPPPKDINLYQSQHALENGKLALKDGGIIIWVSRSRKGVGNDAFLRLLHSIEDYDEVKDELRRGYKLGYHKAIKIMQMKLWCDIWTVAGVEPDIISEAKMRPYAGLQAAVDDAISTMRGRGTEPTMAVLPNGGTTVPRIQGCYR